MKQWQEEAGVALRPATAEDAEFLASVYASTRADELAVTGWNDAQKADFCRSQYRAQEVSYRTQNPAAEYYVIERHRFPAGRLILDRRPGEIRIMDLALLPEHRGAGAGTAILRALQAEAEGAGLGLSIHVEKFNPAQRLYLRLGFVPKEDLGVYLLMGWRAVGV